MKRIITCSDGTWNKPSTTHKGKPIRTNVQKIFDLICKRDDRNILQIKYYDQGIGAEGNWFTRTFEGATGKGIDNNIMDAYKFIVWNYEPGDEIYLFGFSRGAYTARSLAGLIRKSGIIKKNDLNLLSRAYQLYRNHDAGPESDEAVEFRKHNSFDVYNIKFIGVWDTVGSLGIPLHLFQWFNRKKYSFYDTTLSSIVQYAYHAISIDERRGNFKPTLWELSHNKARDFEQVLEQRWFAGVHSNVGGGYPDEGLSDIALKWITEKAAETGLGYDADKLKNEIKVNVGGTLYSSAKGIFAWLPTSDRSITTGVVDDSVFERMTLVKDYKPKNVNVKMKRSVDEVVTG
jgi:uncharacterized protein (DUF2235 family)